MNTIVQSGWTQPPVQTELVKGLKVHTCEPLARRRFDPVITFCAGLGMGGWLFEELMQVLAQYGIKSRAVTFRGHTGSYAVDNIGNVSIGDYAEDLATVVDHFNEDVILAPHSMGGLVAPIVAAECAQVLAHISMTSAPPRGIIAGKNMIPRVGPHLGDIVRCRPVMMTREDVKALFFNHASDAECDECYEQMCPESGRVIREILLMKYAMPRLRCPVLAIGGEHDVITPHQKFLAHQLGATDRNIVFLDSDHMLMKSSMVDDLATVIHTWISNGYEMRMEFKKAA